MDKQTAAEKRFQAYHIDYLVNYLSIGSYAAAKGLTYETAKHRLQTAEKVHDRLVASNTNTHKQRSHPRGRSTATHYTL